MTHLPLTFEDPVFAIGDQVRAMRSFYPHLSEGEVLEVVDYEPKFFSNADSAYMWPAYVKVKQGSEIRSYHASRFEKVPTT